MDDPRAPIAKRVEERLAAEREDRRKQDTLARYDRLKLPLLPISL